jgi:hypothetical protein
MSTAPGALTGLLTVSIQAAYTNVAVGTVCDDNNVCTTASVCGPRLGENFDGVTAPALPAGWTTGGTGNLWTTDTTYFDTAEVRRGQAKKKWAPPSATCETNVL